MEAARPATPDDLEAIVALARRQRAEAVASRGGSLWTAREARSEPLSEAYLRLIDGHDASLVVGCVADVVVGFGAAVVESLHDGRPLGIVTDLYVEPGARGVGVGEAVLDQLVSFCAERGCAGVDALALPGERETKNFFEGSGFAARALVMHRRIAGSSPPAEGP